ncbi:MAG: hypothetical protein RL607_2355 [Bacteroidota bacterium]|jgi:uncharacterized Tic20 family protein
MESNERNTATLLHLSALTQYVFPLANYIVPTLIWSSKKENSIFIDQSGRRVLNFQLSMFLYTMVLGMTGLVLLISALLHHGGEFTIDSESVHFGQFMHQEWTSWFVIGIAALVILAILKTAEFVLIIYGAVKASNGILYTYPLSIPFFKLNTVPTIITESTVNESTTENHQ